MACGIHVCNDSESFICDIFFSYTSTYTYKQYKYIHMQAGMKFDFLFAFINGNSSWEPLPECLLAQLEIHMDFSSLHHDTCSAQSFVPQYWCVTRTCTYGTYGCTDKYVKVNTHAYRLTDKNISACASQVPIVRIFACYDPLTCPPKMGWHWNCRTCNNVTHPAAFATMLQCDPSRLAEPISP